MGICMPHVEGVLSLFVRFWSVVLAGCTIGCSTYYEVELHLLHMLLYSPTEYSEVDQALTLTVYESGYYYVDQVFWMTHRGTLSEEQLSDLHAHTTLSAFDTLEAFSVELDRCKRQLNDDAYFVSDCIWHDLCVVPEDVTGEAKEHINYLVALFKELTSGLPPGYDKW